MSPEIKNQLQGHILLEAAAIALSVTLKAGWTL